MIYNISFRIQYLKNHKKCNGIYERFSLKILNNDVRIIEQHITYEKVNSAVDEDSGLWGQVF